MRINLSTLNNVCLDCTDEVEEKTDCDSCGVNKLERSIEINNIKNKIDPEHFLSWLKAEGEDIIPDYHISVSTMCEYSCLYIGMLLYNEDISNRLSIYYGRYKLNDSISPEHYWIGFDSNGKEYFIDLTISQFNKELPRLLIIEKDKARDFGYRFSNQNPTKIKKYIKDVEGFRFYVDPRNI